MHVNVNFSSFSAPRPLSSLCLEEKEKEPLATEKAWKSSLAFTKESLEFLASPKYSLFLQGVKALWAAGSGGYFDGVGKLLGGLCIMASPVWGLIRLGVGAPCVVAGAAATAGSSLAIGVEWSGRRVKRLTAPSDASLQREALAGKLVERMGSFLEGMPYHQRQFFKEHREILLMISLVAVAFNSRNSREKRLQVGFQELTLDKILDGRCKKYFKSLCEMQEAIASLKLDSKREKAWSRLMELSTSLDEQTFQDQDEQETVALLLQRAHELSCEIIREKSFEKAWEKAFG